MSYSMSSFASSRSSVDENRPKAWIRQRLLRPAKQDIRTMIQLVYRPALYQTMVALAKESSSPVWPWISISIEFVQMLAYCFPHINWGTLGSSFGSVIRLFQFEFIFYIALGVQYSAENGWTNKLQEYQAIGLWILASFSLLVVVTMVSLLFYVFSSFTTKTFGAGVKPLRVLRFLGKLLFFLLQVSLLCGVLYVPILQILVSALKYGAYYDPAMAAVGGIGVCLVVPFCFLMSFTYFNPNPTSDALLSRVSPTLEVLETAMKTTVVFLDVLASEVPGARAIAIWLVTMLLIGFILVYFPYYRRVVNYFRLLLLTALSYAAMLAMVSAYGATKTDEEGNVFIYVFFGLIPVIWSIVSWKFNTYYGMKTSGLFKKLDSLAGGEKKPKQFYEQQLQDIKFRSPLFVELATRYLINATGSSETETVEREKALIIGSAIYTRGMALFPGNALMFALSGIYYGVYRQDFNAWKIQLDKAEKANPGFYTGLLIAQSLSERQTQVRRMKQRGEHVLDAVDLIEIKNSLKYSERKIKKFKKHSLDLWKLMLSGKVDPKKVQKLVSKMYESQTDAKQMLETTCAKFPDNMEALMYYAVFLDEVERAYEDSTELWNYIEEMKHERREQEKRMEVQSGAVLPLALNIVSSQVMSNETIDSQRQGGSMAINGIQSVAGMRTKDMTTSHLSLFLSKIERRPAPLKGKELRKFNEYRSVVKGIKANAIPYVTRMLRLSILFFVVMPIIQLVWIFVVRDGINGNVEDIVLSASRREDAVSVPFYLNLMRDLVQTNSSEESGVNSYMRTQFPLNHKSGLYAKFNGEVVPKEFIDLKERLEKELKVFDEVQKHLFFTANQNSEYYKKWVEPSINITVFRGNDKPPYDTALSHWDASSEFKRYITQLLIQRSPYELYRFNACDTNENWRFIMDNFAFSYADAFDEGTSDFRKSSIEELHAFLDMGWIILGCAGGAVLLIGVIFIRPAVDAVFHDFKFSTAALMNVSRAHVEANYNTIKTLINFKEKKRKKKNASVRKSAKLEDSDGDSGDETIEKESDQEAVASTEDKKDRIASLSDEDDQDEDEDDEEFIVHGRDESANSSHSRLYRRFTLRYILALALIIAVFVTMTLLTYFNTLELAQENIKTDLGLRIRFISWRIGYGTLMTTRNDTFTFPDQEIIRQSIESDMELFNQIGEALLYGDEKLGIEGNGIPDDTRNVLLEPYFMNSTTSLTDMVHEVLQSLRVLLVKEFPTARNDSSVAIILERIPSIIEGYGKLAEIERSGVDKQLAYSITVVQAMFGVALFVLVSVYFAIFRPLLDGLHHEHNKARLLLLQIPVEAVKTNYPLQVMMRGKAAADDMFSEMTEEYEFQDELPIPKEPVVNVQYYRAVIGESVNSVAYRMRMLWRKFSEKKLKAPIEIKSKEATYVQQPQNVLKTAEVAEEGATGFEKAPERKVKRFGSFTRFYKSFSKSSNSDDYEELRNGGNEAEESLINPSASTEYPLLPPSPPSIVIDKVSAAEPSPPSSLIVQDSKSSLKPAVGRSRDLTSSVESADKRVKFSEK